MTQSYQSSIDTAKKELETAENALARDMAQAFMGATLAGLFRDRYDVLAFVEQSCELAEDGAFRTNLHASGDKLRQQQGRPRGRPPKPVKASQQKKGAAQPTTANAA